MIGIYGSAACPNLEEFVHCRNCPVYSQEGRRLLDREPAGDSIREWTDLLRQEKILDAVATTSVGVFRLGQEWLALKTLVLAKIVRARVVHKIPRRSNDTLLGLVNIDGELLLCVSLTQVLNLDTAHEPVGPDRAGDSGRRMIVVGEGAERWVFPVDAMDRIYHVPAAAMEPVPVTVTKAALSYSQGIFRLDGKTVAFLDEQLLFSTLGRSLRWQTMS